MKSFLLLSLMFFAASPLLTASEASQQEYFQLIERYPALVSPRGNASKGEIEIILDKDKIAAIEKKTGRDVGVMKKDAYWLWVNDACLFPNGKEGVYGRMLWVQSLWGPPGVAIMPILPDGRIALNCNFRHSTRSWEIELAKGLIELGEAPEQAARREAKEETGMIVDQVQLLGSMPTATGSFGAIEMVFTANVLSSEEQETEDSEAIEEILCLTVEEIKEAFQKGFYKMSIRGEEKEVFFRDPTLAYALTLYLGGGS